MFTQPQRPQDMHIGDLLDATATRTLVYRENQFGELEIKVAGSWRPAPRGRTWQRLTALTLMFTRRMRKATEKIEAREAALRAQFGEAPGHLMSEGEYLTMRERAQFNACAHDEDSAERLARRIRGSVLRP